VILLLKQPHLFSEAEIRSAAERAWGIAFRNTSGSTRRVIVCDDKRVFLQAGPHELSICSQPWAYVENPETDVDWLPSLNQQRAWGDHKACCLIYYLTETADVELAHCVIAKFAAELVDQNCIGAYMRDQFALIPAESLLEELRSMGAYHSSESAI